MHILEILQELKAQTGKGSAGRKMDILMKNRDNLLLKSFFFWALDPNTNYWQSKISDTNLYSMLPKVYRNLEDTMIVVIDELSTRQTSGNKAKALLTKLYCDLSPNDAVILERIITGKPDIGCGVGTINKVWEELIYDPAYMRCKGYSPKAVADWDFENEVIYSNLKADGMFDNMILGKTLEFETRSGESLPLVVSGLSFEHIQCLSIIRDCLDDVVEPVLHGEFLVVNNDGIMERSKGNGLINKVKLGGEFPNDHYLRLVIWDYIPLENFYSHEEYPVPYDVKFDRLVNIMKSISCDKVQLIEYKRVFSKMDAQQHFVKCLQAGFEGTVLKNASRLTWKNHDSPNQLKLKNKFRFEMRVTGFTVGEGKFASTFGSMLIESEDGLLKSAISGIKDKLRQDIHNRRGSFIDAIVECEANGLFVNDDGSYGLMHPRFKHLRSKTFADTLARIIQQEMDSIAGKEAEKGV